jgi:hypothetical protein
MSKLERMRTALEDIIALRHAGLDSRNQLVLKCMTMDVLYAHLRQQVSHEYPHLSPLFEAWSLELAVRTQAMMDLCDLSPTRQKTLGEYAKLLAHELEQRFLDRMFTRH